MKYTPIGIIVDKSKATKRHLPELAPYPRDSLVYADNFETYISERGHSRDVSLTTKGKISRILDILFE